MNTTSQIGEHEGEFDLEDFLNLKSLITLLPALNVMGFTLIEDFLQCNEQDLRQIAKEANMKVCLSN